MTALGMVAAVAAALVLLDLTMWGVAALSNLFFGGRW